MANDQVASPNRSKPSGPAESHVLDHVHFALQLPELCKRLRVREGSSHERELRSLAEEARAIARPKALYEVAFVEGREDEHVTLGGVRLTSHVLRVNLDGVHRAFPYLATCGVELGQWYSAQGDLLRQFWAETIAELALRAAMAAARRQVLARYRPGRLTSMSPGSLPDWPIEQQRQLFALLGDTQATLGVRLTDSMLMMPTKSVSGIFFPTETHFESCQLCQRPHCPGRRAPYDGALWESRFARSVRGRPES